VNVLRTVLFALLFVCPIHAAKQKDIQSLTIELSPTASDAVIPIYVWFTVSMQGPQGPKHRIDTVVAGTGFLVDTQGDFVTAGHVLDTSSLTRDPNISDVRLTALIRQRTGGGSAQSFAITDRDDDHDLVLCHIPGFNAVTPEKSVVPKGTNLDTAHPFASLAISTAIPKTGQFVIVSGYPLNSLTPTIQFGMVSATDTFYQDKVPGMGTRKDTFDLLQISVNANHGNSGGPVIDLNSGQVIGVIDQLVPAPLQIGGQQIRDQNTFEASGIMLAAPAKWVEALLEKNHIKSEGVPLGDHQGFQPEN
jgi:S1-C subfamily serine protease